MRTLVFRLLSAALTAALLAGCTGGLPSEAVSGPASSAPASSTTQKEESSMTIQLQVNGSTFTAALEQNAAARALVELLLTIQMQNYGGFEKVGSLGESLPASDQQTTTQPGDIVLYQGDQIVIFYGSNSWSYTRLGRVDDLTGWADALGTGDVTVTFSLAE